MDLVLPYTDITLRISSITFPLFLFALKTPKPHWSQPCLITALKSRPVIAALDPVKCHWCRFAIRPGRLISGTFERKRLLDVVGVVAVCIFLWLSGHCLKSAITYVVSYICFFMFFKQPMLMIPNRQSRMNYRHVI